MFPPVARSPFGFRNTLNAANDGVYVIHGYAPAWLSAAPRTSTPAKFLKMQASFPDS